MTPETIELIRYGIDAVFWLALAWIVGRALMSVAISLMTIAKM